MTLLATGNEAKEDQTGAEVKAVIARTPTDHTDVCLGSFAGIRRAQPGPLCL